MLDQKWKQLSTGGRIGGNIYARRSEIPGVIELRKGHDDATTEFYTESELRTLFTLLEW